MQLFSVLLWHISYPPKIAKCNKRQQLVLQFCCCCRKYNVELDSTFCNNCGNTFMDFVSIVQCNTPSATWRLTMLCSISQSGSYYPLPGPPRSQFCELLAVSLYSATPGPLFLQLQCYAFKHRKTSCTKIASCKSASRVMWPIPP